MQIKCIIHNLILSLKFKLHHLIQEKLQQFQEMVLKL